MQKSLLPRSAFWITAALIAGTTAFTTTSSIAAPPTKSATPKPTAAKPGTGKPLPTKPTAPKTTPPKPTAPGPTTSKPATKAADSGEKREPYQPSFSSDGKRVVYVEQIFRPEKRFEAHHQNLWVMDLAAQRARRLTEGQLDMYPRFSADGTRVVFTRGGDIWTINADGTQLQNVTKTPTTDENHGEFTNDGNSVLFIRFYEGNGEDEEHFGSVAFRRGLADGTERILLDDDYQAMQIIPNRQDDSRFYVVCKRLDAKGKPVPEVTLDNAVAEFNMDGTWMRTLYTPKRTNEKEDSGMDIGVVRATDSGLLLNLSRSLDISTHLLTPQGMKTLPDVALAHDITRDGRQIVAIRAPRGSLVRCLEFYDVATGKSTLLRLLAPTQKPAAPAKTPAVAPPPTTPAAFVSRGYEHHKAGRYDEAISDYNEALRLDPKNALALFRRGQAREFKIDFDGALADYEAAVRYDPNLVQAHIERAFLLNSKERSGEAIDAYDTAIRLDPKNVEALFLRGEAYAARQDIAEAIADYDVVLKINPDHFPALMSRGTQFFETGDNPAALADLNRAIQLLPGEIKAYRKRAEIHREMGNTEAAEADERKAQELSKP